MSSGYRELNAPSALCHAVEAVWLREPEFQASRSIAILPDGCMDLICRYEVGADGGAADVKLLVSGPDRSTRHMTVERGIGFVGIRFRPGWARGILDIDASPLVDVGTVAGAITPRLEALERRLLDCGSPAALQRRLENELLLGAATRRAPPSRVRAAVGRLGQPSVRVDTVADELGLTPRSLHREIVAWTGLGPKQLMRILRLQATLARLRARSEPLAVLAMEAGYADQAHMTREFRALAGATPHWFNGRPIRSRQRTSGG